MLALLPVFMWGRLLVRAAAHTSTHTASTHGTHTRTHAPTHTRERTCTCTQDTQTHTWAHACTWTVLQQVVHVNCNASMYMSIFASSSQQLKARDKKPFFHLAVLPHSELHEQATTRQCKSDRGWNRPLLYITSVMHPGSTSWAGHCAVGSCTGTHAAPPSCASQSPHHCSSQAPTATCTTTWRRMAGM